MGFLGVCCALVRHRMVGCVAVAVFVVAAETGWVLDGPRGVPARSCFCPSRLPARRGCRHGDALTWMGVDSNGRTELATDCSVDPWAPSCHPASMMVSCCLRVATQSRLGEGLARDTQERRRRSA